MKKYESEFQFLGYNVNYIKVNLNKSFNEKECNLKIQFDYKVDNNEELNVVTLSTEIGDKEDSPFLITASITGKFKILTNEIDDETIEILVNQNALSILFPYLRSLITTITANCNINPIILPTINIARMMNEQKPNN